MKKLILAITFFIPLLANAQTKSEIQVADAVEQLKKAMIDGDKTMLEKLAAENLSYGHSSGLVENKKEFIEKIVSGNSDFLSIDLNEQTISISGNTAIVRHVLKAKTHDKGKEIGNVQIKVLLIWQRQKGGWKLLARQAIKLV